MKYLLAFLLVAIHSAQAAGLPDIEQVLRVNFQPATCGNNAPEIAKTFTIPPAGYDTAGTDWFMGLRQSLVVTSFSPLGGTTATVTTPEFKMQARFPIGVTSGGANWTSTGWNVNPIVFSVSAPALGTNSGSQVTRYNYLGLAGGIDQMTFIGNQVYFKCLGSTANQLQMNGSGQVQMDVDGIGALFRLTWKDLL